MSNDASLPPNAPMTNGVPSGHGEADVSKPSTPTATTTLADVCADLHRRVSAFLTAHPKNEITRRTQEQTRISLGVVQRALDDYGFDHLSLSYNGGKDCLVLLILYLSVLHTHFSQTPAQQSTPFPTSIPSIYAKPPDPFPAVSHFVHISSHHYHLSLTHISTSKPVHPHKSTTTAHSAAQTLPQTQTSNVPTSSAQRDGEEEELLHPPSQTRTFSFPGAFEYYLSLHPEDDSEGHGTTTDRVKDVRNNSKIKAVFVGTRRTDPHGADLTHFDHTSSNWPPFMRVHPVIDWHLSEIWCFLKAPELHEADGTQLPYCSMYDQGYTSLGGVGDTLKNPKLRFIAVDGRESYRPAFVLTEDDQERLGRE